MSEPQKMLRVLVTLPGIIGFQLDVESNVRQLIALARRGHEITCLTVGMLGARKVASNTSNFRLETISIRKLNPLVSRIFVEILILWRVLKSLAHYDAIVLDVYSLAMTFPFIHFQRFRENRPVLFLRVESNPVETGGYLRSLMLTFMYDLSIKLAGHFFDKIFFISPMLGRLYSILGISGSKLAVWPSAVDLEIFKPIRGDRVEELRRKLGLAHRVAFLYHGWLSKAVGILEMLEAFKILKDESVPAKLILLGDGPAREDALKYIKTNNLQDVVQLCGPVDHLEVPLYIAASDAGIVALPDHPWWRYQCPTKVLECLAMNKPLIMSDIPAHRWIAGDSPGVLYLKGTSSHEIVDGVRKFIRLRLKLHPEFGRRQVTRFSTTEIANSIEREIIDSLRHRAGSNRH